MKAFAIYDNDYNMGEKLCYMVALEDNENTEEFCYLLDELKEDYYNKIEEDDVFQEENSLENYIYDELEKRGYEFLNVGGEYDLS